MNSPNPLASGRAPGKIILFGEHAVVYGRPAIAAPLQQVEAHVEIFADTQCMVQALDLGRIIPVAAAPPEDPFAAIVRLVCSELSQPLPMWRIVVRSQIPIAAGLGSGAAIAAAMARALSSGFGHDLPPQRLSELVFEIERLHHGTPSGIDNTVVIYEQPVWFVRGQSPQVFTLGKELHLLIADTGISSPTRTTVADVRRAWQEDPPRYESLFDQVGGIVLAARQAMLAGDLTALGHLMNANQNLLSDIGVSSPELDHLCAIALSAGAHGSKLSGGGRGGNMVALFSEPDIEHGRSALLSAGARGVIYTQLQPTAQAAIEPYE